MLAELRGVGRERPHHDPLLAEQVRAPLERAAEAAPDLEAAGPVLLTKDRLRRVLLCERHLVASLGPPPRPSLEMVRGRLLDYVFGQVVMGFPPGPDPMAEALEAAAASDDVTLLADWASLTADEQAELAYTVPALASDLARRWPALPANAWPRLQEPLRAELADGRVLLAGRADLVLGAPGPDRAGTSLVDLKSGNRRYDDVQDAGWYAVLETLRHRSAPFQTGNYYLQDGFLRLETVTPEMLLHHAHRAADGLGRLLRLTTGEEPEVTPTGLCPWCPALPRCAPGRRHTAERGVIPVGAMAEEDHDDDE